jgi:uncharacterized protein (TIGR03437 family)
MRSLWSQAIISIGMWSAVACGTFVAHAAESDALAISANIQARHLPFGTVLDPISGSAESNQVVGYTRCGDSAIWTGHYLAAEAFRYNVTHAPDALKNVKTSIAGIKSLVDVTGTNLLARCLVPMSSPFAAGIQSEESHSGIYTNNSAGEIWVGNTSRDQYSGVMFGLSVAFDMVDDAGVRSSVSDLVTRMIDFLRGHSWSVVMPDGSTSTTFAIRPDQILSFLQVARHVNSDRFSTTYDIQRILLAATVTIPIGVEVTSDDSYFKFNLDYINLYNLIRLESGSATTLYRAAYNILRNHTAEHQNAFFDVIDRGLNGPNPARDAEIRSLLSLWLLRSRRDRSVDLHGTVPVCGDQACQPVPVNLRPPTDFLWQRNPFQLAGGGTGLIESAGIDYILPYWMARYYGVALATDITIHSAAADSAAIAPDSIASIFGSGFSTGTFQAGSAVLPTTLGGVVVKVHDNTGVDRDAALIYVSPGQVNLVVPAGTAAGPTQFTVGSQSVTATVQAVAPTLFSMNGNGAGVAAATAIRVQAGNPQVQNPVTVFACVGLGCVSTPIDLGVDAPVYLTLYGTGLRKLSSLSNVVATINNVRVPVLYAGPQPQFPGLDQVNVQLLLTLRGSGESNIVVTVDGQVSNTVTVNIR